MDTRKNEIRFTTSDPSKMLGKYIGSKLARKWSEDFIDEDTGEVASLEREEFIASRGTEIDPDVLSRIAFHLQAGDIKEVDVSSQKRDAILVLATYLSMWVVTAKIDDKNVKFLLYANSVNMAIEIVEDYVELNYSGRFRIIGAKNHDATAFIKDRYIPAEDVTSQEEDQEEEQLADDTENKKFYNIEIYATIKIDGEEHATSSYGNFIVEAKDIDRSLILIKDYVRKRTLTIPGLTMSSMIDISLKLETAKFFSCKVIIDKEFSMVYKDDKDTLDRVRAKAIASFNT